MVSKRIRQVQGRPKIIAVVGPTASGKTSLGIFLAKKLGGPPRRGAEIISADSRQVYKSLDIGTGKVTKKEMAGVPHHLLNVISPRKQFSVDDFVKKSQRRIDVMIHQNKAPIIVGGTGLYVDALLGRITFPNVPPNPKLRERLEKKSVEALFKMLKKKDPERAKTIEPKNKRRLIRALEISIFSKKQKFSEDPSRSEPSSGSSSRMRRPEENEQATYDVLWLGLYPGEEKLKKNIHSRLLARIHRGMAAEAKRLHAKGLSYRRMRELGLEYRFLADLLQQKISKQEFEEGLERAINHYAKRQMRWFKRNKDINWVNSTSDALKLSRAFLAGPQPRRSSHSRRPGRAGSR